MKVILDFPTSAIVTLSRLKPLFVGYSDEQIIEAALNRLTMEEDPIEDKNISLIVGKVMDMPIGRSFNLSGVIRATGIEVENRARFGEEVKEALLSRELVQIAPNTKGKVTTYVRV